MDASLAEVQGLVGERQIPSSPIRNQPRFWKRLAPLVPPIVLIILWELLTVSGVIAQRVLPLPASVANALGSEVAHSATWTAIGQTLDTWIVGLALAVVVGVLCGAAMGASLAVYRSVSFVVDFLRAVPPVAILPLLLLIFGTRYDMTIVLVVFASVWIILVQTTQGIRDLDPMLRQVVQSYRLGWKQRFVWVTLPSIAPYLVTAIRLASVTALFAAFVAEFLGGAAGLGLLLAQTANGTTPSDAYALGIIGAVLALILNSLFSSFEDRALKWLPRSRSRRA